MYNRAPRPLTQASSQHQACPGQYDGAPRAGAKKGGGKGAFAPFGALAPRETIFETSPFAPALPPPPGQYELGTTVGKDVTGGSSLANTSKRFPSAPARAPPPTSYQTSKSLRGQEEPPAHVVVRAAGFAQNKKVQGKMVATGGSASIPARTEPWGYERDASGVLVKRLPPRVLPEDVGPGWYSPSHEDHSVTGRYRGVHWAQQTEPRALQLLSGEHAAPPPGTYDPEARPADAPLLVANGKRPGFNAASERALGAPPEVVKDDVPGPNSYTIHSTIVKDSPAVIHPGFGSTRKRFDSAETAAPSPGAYAPSPGAIKPAPHTTVSWMNAQRSPFMHASPRFATDARHTATPGPGTYALDDVPLTSMAAAANKKAHEGPSASFGATDLRTRPLVKAEVGLLPGPGAYSPSASTRERHSSLPSRRPAPARAPGPDATVPADFSEMNMTGRDPGVQPLVSAHPRSPVHRGGFLSNTKRELALGNTQGGPAPGAYEVERHSPAPGGKMADHFRERFTSSETPVPPPSAYYSPAKAVKVSFNVTLTAPIESSLSLPPSPSPLPTTHLSSPIHSLKV